MGWKEDNGYLLKATEAKLYFGQSHTWAMKLSQLSRQKGTVRIVTYSLPDLRYVSEQLGRRPQGIWLICHSKFEERAREIKLLFPDIRIATGDCIHMKVLLIEPATLYIGSANFGVSHWHEATIGLRSVKAHDDFVKSFEWLWNESKEIK